MGQVEIRRRMDLIGLYRETVIKKSFAQIWAEDFFNGDITCPV